VLWTAAGVAAASIAVGVTLIAIDGRGTCTPREPEDQCKELYRTQAGGLALTGLGLVAAVAGALVYSGRFCWVEGSCSCEWVWARRWR
jgi:hypothetical protein